MWGMLHRLVWASHWGCTGESVGPSRAKPPSFFQIWLDCFWKPSLVFNCAAHLSLLLHPLYFDSWASPKEHWYRLLLQFRLVSIRRQQFFFPFFFSLAGCVRFESEGQGCVLYCVRATHNLLGIVALQRRAHDSLPGESSRVFSSFFFCSNVLWLALFDLLSPLTSIIYGFDPYT